MKAHAKIRTSFHSMHGAELSCWCWVITSEDNSYPYSYHEQDSQDYRSEESRRIQCTKCGLSHIWVCTNRSKAKARWCQVTLSLSLPHFCTSFCRHEFWDLFWHQDCCQYHQAKDGDGWVEYRGSLVFECPQKVIHIYILCVCVLKFMSFYF